ncbi:MAG: patatin-like phospholipase family protein, partial [Aquincola sp.]|nr:patatin-like phospholipase family protein [Aquincola sp.]
MLVALTLLLTACASTAHYPINPPLAAIAPDEGYRARGMFRQAGDEELMVIVTFSGGGSRAAALAYGVLEELARTPIQWHGQRQRLLDEVDLVAGVSGGSITAAYWALAGDRIFEDFEPRFL